MKSVSWPGRQLQHRESIRDTRATELQREGIKR